MMEVQFIIDCRVATIDLVELFEEKSSDFVVALTYVDMVLDLFEVDGSGSALGTQLHSRLYYKATHNINYLTQKNIFNSKLTIKLLEGSYLMMKLIFYVW